MRFSNSSQLLWDLWCCVSVVGIWPRYVEPNWLKRTTLTLRVPALPEALDHLKILQLSDLHLNPQVPPRFLQKILKTAKAFSPDLIVFTGDFLSYARLYEKEKLACFLNSFQAPYGCYAVLGNHDYGANVSINAEGDYDVVENSHSSIARGFERLFHTPTLSHRVTARAREVDFHKEFTQLLEKTPFKLLHNKTEVVPIKGSALNICGLGEHMLGKADPKEAFKKYDARYPGIVLVHNPDAVPSLLEYPGDIILSGHTHGIQINLPFFRKPFFLLENPRFARGLIPLKKKWLYVNRGLGSVFRFRWFSPPEILCLTLCRGEETNG